MSDVGNPAVWGLLGTVVGAAASIGTTWLANAHAAKLDDNKHKAVRMETARDFQRKTLIELQEATHKLVRFVTKAHLHDRRAFAGGAQWRTVVLPDELSEEIRDAFRLVTFLTQRVADEPLRTRLKKFIDDTGSCLYAPDAESGAYHWQHLAGDYADMIESLGEVLRKNYEPT